MRYLRWVALLLSAGFLAGLLRAQPSKFGQPDDRPASGLADQEKGAAILAEFQQAGIAGDYWLAVELQVMPRRGEERTVLGSILGTRGVEGPVSRLEVGAERWLIESGRQPAAWQLGSDGKVQELDPAGTGRTIAGTGVTLFDLQMPFLYWRRFTYEGEARVRGRPTHSFILYPPADRPAPLPGLSGVRVLIDVQFQALVQAELLDDRQTAVKSISLLDLKKVGEQWIVKSVDIRDNLTRNKTRLTVTAAALDLHWPAETFLSAGLAEDAPVVPRGRIVRF